MSEIETTKVWLANFTTSAEAAKLSKDFLNHLGFTANYQSARLAIGRSLGEVDFPETAPDAKGMSIKGNLLFDDETKGGLLWLALLVENINQYQPTKTITLELLQHTVRDHWHRGIFLLQNDWEEAESDYSKFVELLITRRAALPSDVEATQKYENGNYSPLIAKPIPLRLGKNTDSGEPINWTINGQGYSPNVAIMGQSGAGKTRMMLKLLTELRELTGVPVLLIDAGKDELAERPDLANALDATVLKIPNQAIPLDIFHGSTLSAETARDVTIAFRESLDKSLQKGLTDNQKMRVLEALKSLFSKRENITMVDVKKNIERYYEENSIKPDRVVTIPNELCQYQLFNPTLSPAEFFNQSWIITFGGAPNESRRLTMFLLFDALHRYLQTLPESPIDKDGHRALRMAVAIDEARPLLDAKHDGLSKMVRLHRSHGLAVFMASQSPDDYAGQSDDYMEQIGLPICFKTNATSTAVLNNMFKSKPNFAALNSGVCLSVINNQMQKITAF
jgi:hypothetical protein